MDEAFNERTKKEEREIKQKGKNIEFRVKRTIFKHEKFDINDNKVFRGSNNKKKIGKFFY